MQVARSADSADLEGRVTVASYYFPNYHSGDERNERAKGKGWTEWSLVKAAKPLFRGHQQPKVPLWGYEDESNPKVMARKIDAAADHGIDAFIFDWYYYNDGPFLQEALNEGFLKAQNHQRLKFSLMWANHDWIDIHPIRKGVTPPLLYPGTVTPEHFDRICDLVISQYFKDPSYWKIAGKPYFSFYDLTNLLKSFGSVPAARVALDRFRAKALAAGLPGLHLNAIVWGQPILPAERVPADAPQLVRDLGFDSVTSYVWIHHATLSSERNDYNEVRDQYFRYWDKATREFELPYFPNVTMGWDGTPRNYGLLGGKVVVGNTPARFEEALRLTRARVLKQDHGPRIVNINCWNEWTEGSYLEPDSVHGMAYLDAVRRVFAQ
jgi:hypothetical protein